MFTLLIRDFKSHKINVNLPPRIPLTQKANSPEQQLPELSQRASLSSFCLFWIITACWLTSTFNHLPARCRGWVLSNGFVVVIILGSDSTPPPASKMSPVSNKFEGIPQQQRYHRREPPIASECSTKAVNNVFMDFWALYIIKVYIFAALLQATQSPHLVQGFFPNYLRKVPSWSDVCEC